MFISFHLPQRWERPFCPGFVQLCPPFSYGQHQKPGPPARGCERESQGKGELVNVPSVPGLAGLLWMDALPDVVASEGGEQDRCYDQRYRGRHMVGQQPFANSAPWLFFGTCANLLGDLSRKVEPLLRHQTK